MTAKEKAEELYEKFQKHALYWDNYSGDPIEENQAKQCAIICVEEILKSFEGFMDQRRHYRHELEIEAERYWQSVKTEIEKL